MNQGQAHVLPVAQDRPNKKQIHMNIHGCSVMLNISSDSSNRTKVETVKRMILGGLSKV